MSNVQRMLGWLSLFGRPPRNEPVPPENVKVELSDGRTIPVELIYVGRTDAGIHHWHAVTNLYDVREIRAMTVDAMPAGTKISISSERRLR